MNLSLNTTNFTALKMTAIVALMSLASVEPLAAFGQQAQSHSAQASTAPVASHQTAAATEEEESAPTPNKPGHEGIKVHGDWVIDVHNADGSLAEHRAFHNSLAEDQGENVLFYLLSGQLTPSSMAIGAFASTSFGGFNIINGGYYLVPANTNTATLCHGLYACVPGATVTVTPGTRSAPSGTFGGTSLIPGKIVLQGQVAPGNGLTINSVATYLIGCHLTGYVGQETLSSSACATGTPVVTNGASPTATLNGQPTDYLTFTSTTIPDVVVASGQYVIISVTISFS